MRKAIAIVLTSLACCAVVGGSVAVAGAQANPKSVIVKIHSFKVVHGHRVACDTLLQGTPNGARTRFKVNPITNTCNDGYRAVGGCLGRTGSGVHVYSNWTTGYAQAETSTCPPNTQIVIGWGQFPRRDTHTYCLWGCSARTAAALTSVPHGRIGFDTTGKCLTSNGVGNQPSMQSCSSGFNALQEWVLTNGGTLCRWDTGNCISVEGSSLVLTSGSGTIGWNYNNDRTITGPLGSATGYLTWDGVTGDTTYLASSPVTGQSAPWYYFTTTGKAKTVAVLLDSYQQHNPFKESAVHLMPNKKISCNAPWDTGVRQAGPGAAEGDWEGQNCNFGLQIKGSFESRFNGSKTVKSGIVTRNELEAVAGAPSGFPVLGEAWINFRESTNPVLWTGWCEFWPVFHNCHT